jgi:XTP/dITP diphosphohydrolase
MDNEARLVLATKNPGKIREFDRLLRELAPGVTWKLVSAGEAGLADVEETGRTFLDNARVKAVSAAAQTGAVCLGEDSGLEVDYLDGAPGVNSHRYSDTGTDRDNNLLLLRQLEGVSVASRTARYRCALVLAGSERVLAEAEGTVDGVITTEISGQNGFGYDPLFYSVELGKTMGQASAAEKDSVSHRRRAIERIVPVLCRELAQTRAAPPEEESS